jgi:predicted nucleic acid-binding protein
MSSALAKVEVPRALQHAGYGAAEDRRAADVLIRVTLNKIDPRIRQSATPLGSSGLRGLDAIHLATARSVGEDLAGIVTYDQRRSDAATSADVGV